MVRDAESRGDADREAEVTCIRGGFDGHEKRYCSAPFSKAWPGQPAVKVRVRLALGQIVEYECPLSAEEAQLHADLADSFK